MTRFPAALYPLLGCPVRGNESRSDSPTAGSESRSDSPTAGSESRSDSTTAASESRSDSPTAGSESRSDSPTPASESRSDSPTAGSESRSDSPTAGSESRSDSPTPASESRSDSPTAPRLSAYRAAGRTERPALHFSLASRRRLLYNRNINRKPPGVPQRKRSRLLVVTESSHHVALAPLFLHPLLRSRSGSGRSPAAPGSPLRERSASEEEGARQLHQ